MGTTSEKLTYLNDTKQLLKDSINSLGGEITSQTTFRQYATELDSIYASLPKVSGTGSNIQLTPTKKGRITSQINGDTFQQTYSGKNLLPNNVTSGTRNGITWVVNNDGTILINGTATAQVNISTSSYYFPIDGAYIVSGCPSGGNSNTYSLVVGYYDENKAWKAEAYDTGSGKVLNQNYAYANVGILIRSGTTCNNLLFKPMLEAGSQVTSYEPYVGGTTSPNPSYPQPVNVVSVGKNLLPISTLATQTKNGITFTNNNNGSYTFNGTATAYTTFVLNNDLSFNGNYTYVMRDTATSGFVMYLQNSSGQGIGQATTHTTIDNSIGIMVIGINNGVSLNNVTIKPYVYKGAYDSTIEYEPYQGNTYNIDLPVENLMDRNYFTTKAESWPAYENQGGAFKLIPFYVGTGTSVTFSSNVPVASSSTIYAVDELGRTQGTTNNINVNTTRTIVGGTNGYVYLGFVTSRQYYTDLLNGTYWVQIEVGSKANSYTPYGTTPIELGLISTYKDKFIRASGKNLLQEGFRQGNTTSTTATNRIFTTYSTYLKANETYTISTNINTSNFYWTIRVASSEFPTNADVYTGDWLTSSNYT